MTGEELKCRPTCASRWVDRFVLLWATSLCELLAAMLDMIRNKETERLGLKLENVKHPKVKETF